MDRNIFAACGALALAGITLSASQTPSPAQPGTQPTQAAGGGSTVTITGCLKPWSGAASSGSATTGGAATPGSTATTGAAGATAQYVLTAIDDKGANRGGSTTAGASGSTPGTPGTAGTPGQSMPGTTGTSGTAGAASHGEGAMDKGDYLLRAEGSSVNLSQHVNHKVEVTGRKMAANDSRGSSMGTTSPATTGTAGATGTTGTPSTAGSTGSTATGTSGMSGRAAGANMQTLTVTSVKMISATCQ